jgi:ribosome-associated protein
MLLALNVDVIAIAEVIAFATASHVDKAVHGVALAEGTADVALGFFQGNLSGDDQLDVEILRILDFFLCHIVPFWRAKIRKMWGFCVFVVSLCQENNKAMARKLNRIIFTLREGEDFIPLISLLKACDVVYSGAEAQEVVTTGMVLRNGEVETRKRAKITAGEVIVFENVEILVEGWDG